jgi:hypothetical protein
MTTRIAPEELFGPEYWDTNFECDRCGNNFPIDTVVRIRLLNTFPLYYCQGCAGKTEYRL